MVSTGVKCGGMVSILIVLAAYFYKQQSEDILNDQLENILLGLERAEQQVGVESDKPKVAVGFGACQDVVTSATSLLYNLGAQAPETPEYVDDIVTQENFEKVFAYFFRHGAAAERYIRNETLFLELVSKALEDPTSATLLGGNAPVMARRFHLEGCRVLLGGTASESLRKEIHEDIRVAGKLLEDDDIHLGLEYEKGDSWDHYTSPRGNRFFFHHDENNPLLTSLEDFEEELHPFSPTLLVVSGLQMLDNFPFEAGQREARLLKLSNLLSNVAPETRIHFEMASFAEEDYLKQIVDNVVFYSDSLGMNEQELPNLYSILTDGSVTLISDPYPRIATTLDHMRELYSLLESTDTMNGRRKITRLHVHTLAYQAILTTKDSSWKNSMSAAAKASLTASRYTCGKSTVKTENSQLLMDDSFSKSRGSEGERVLLEPDRPVSCWEENGGKWEICLAPVLVCTKVVRTGGAGDNVSSAGLVLQI